MSDGKVCILIFGAAMLFIAGDMVGHRAADRWWEKQQQLHARCVNLEMFSRECLEKRK